MHYNMRECVIEAKHKDKKRLKYVKLLNNQLSNKKERKRKHVLETATTFSQQTFHAKSEVPAI